VTVKVEPADHEVAISVLDQGIGLAPENLGRIFNKFFQVDAAYTSASGGIGIGLTIAREIVEAHGGRIGVKSDGLGLGANFTFVLPIESQ
jgi:signal transduction histidine kinase